MCLRNCLEVISTKFHRRWTKYMTSEAFSTFCKNPTWWPDCIGGHQWIMDFELWLETSHWWKLDESVNTYQHEHNLDIVLFRVWSKCMLRTRSWIHISFMIRQSIDELSFLTSGGNFRIYFISFFLNHSCKGPRPSQISSMTLEDNVMSETGYKALISELQEWHQSTTLRWHTLLSKM